jgi:hypothetical protein
LKNGPHEALRDRSPARSIVGKGHGTLPDHLDDAHAADDESDALFGERCMRAIIKSAADALARMTPAT